MNRKYAVIIGAGISGLTAARILAEAEYHVTVLEKRSHIGGNVYDYFENGVLVHQYGPHLFHTNMRHIVEFLQRFSEFFPYEHRVLGEVQGKLIPIPFNFKSIDLLYPAGQAQQLKQVLSKAYPGGESVAVMELRGHKDPQVRALAEFVYQNVFYGYTKKQWGKPPQELDGSVMGRVPVRMSYDDRYFTDEFQMMPSLGYTAMLERMADHENIAIRYECDALLYLKLQERQVYLDGERFDGPVIYTGCLDELFGCRYGRLPYRSLDFVLERRGVTQAQPAVQVNYPNRFSYTRTSEFHLVQQDPVKGRTILVYEYPKECKDGDLPYYPVESEASRNIYQKYRMLAEQIPNLALAGRLAEYRYYNMDLAIDRAMRLAYEMAKI